MTQSTSADFPVRTGGHQVASWMEVTINETVSGKEILSLIGRFKTLHLAFSASGRPMRVLRAIVQISALSMFDLRQELAMCHAVASQFVGHDHAGFVL
jgi:hypothetical protein